MKQIVVLLLPLLCVMAEQKAPARKSTSNGAVAKSSSRQAKAPATAAQPKVTGSDSAINPPAGAVEIAPKVWRHTDKAGKTWIYRPTPFGLSRTEEQASATSPAGDVSAPPAGAPVIRVKATDLGDSVKFEMPSMMGP